MWSSKHWGFAKHQKCKDYRTHLNGMKKTFKWYIIMFILKCSTIILPYHSMYHNIVKYTIWYRYVKISLYQLKFYGIIFYKKKMVKNLIKITYHIKYNYYMSHYPLLSCYYILWHYILLILILSVLKFWSFPDGPHKPNYLWKPGGELHTN